jgi:AcrR family transcriptional regulator
VTAQPSTLASGDGSRPVTSTPTPRQCFLAVPRPEPILGAERMATLTVRQAEILDHLVTVFSSGFAHLTMAAIAAELKCSLRTLYALAPTRDELMLIGIERTLWTIGRSARAAVVDDMTALEAVQAYLHGATVSLTAASDAFARDLALVPAVSGLIVRHNTYAFEVTRALLDLAVERGEMRPTDTMAIARVMAGLGWAFTCSEIKRDLRSTPKVAADEVVDAMVRGLASDGDGRRR